MILRSLSIDLDVGLIYMRLKIQESWAELREWSGWLSKN